MTNKTHKKLREGFTTGSAATAASMAALEILLHDGKGEESVNTFVQHVPVPPPEQGGEEIHLGLPLLRIPIAEVQRLGASIATAYVIKDGGDDPDATHGAHIQATVTLVPEQPDIHIEGGQGVGRVTLPGLPLPVGMAAINPAPRRQITTGLRMLMQKYQYVNGVSVVVSVPHGEAIAQHTFNPRLGIVGGISILGTQGTVRPYSHSAWKATILQGFNVAQATGCRTLCLSTGRRSERLLLNKYPQVSLQSAIQAADFAHFSLYHAGKYPFEKLVWGCFFGKLVKLAQGHKYTHARHAELDFTLLQTWCAEAGADIPEITQCVTASHALEYILAHAAKERVIKSITQKAADVACAFAGRSVRVYVFHLDGYELAWAESIK